MVLPVVLVAAMCCGVAVLMSFGWRAVLYPYALDYGEGPVLDQAIRLARLVNIYQIPGPTPPWTISNYTPLYPTALAPLTLAFGPAYWYGRLLSLVSVAVTAVLAGSIVRRFTGDRFAAVVSGMLVPMFPAVGLSALLARVDCLALMLSVAGLWCVLRWPERRLGLLFGIVLLAAAIYTKQSYAAVAPVVAIVWLWGLGRRRALMFAAALAAVVGGVGIVMSVATGGGFWFHVVTGNVGAYYWSMVAWYGGFAAIYLPAFVLAGIAFTIVRLKSSDRGMRIVWWYLLGALAVSFAVGKIGSNVNYLMELGVALCLAAGMLLAWLRTRAWARQAVTAALAIQVAFLVWTSDISYGSYADRMADSSADTRLMQIVQSAPGPVLADEEIGLLPLAGRPVEVEPFAIMQVVQAGNWDDAPLLRAIRDQRYAVILIYDLDEDKPYTAALLAEIKRRYVVREEVSRSGALGGSPTPGARTLVYRPRP